MLRLTDRGVIARSRTVIDVVLMAWSVFLLGGDAGSTPEGCTGHCSLRQSCAQAMGSSDLAALDHQLMVSDRVLPLGTVLSPLVAACTMCTASAAA